ncbi:hypothetical protein AAG906_039442 [Vitis piasezkii]
MGALILMAWNKRTLITTLLMRRTHSMLNWNAGIIRTIFAEEEPGEMVDMHRNFSIPSP